jgi:ABC-type nitrate/sulfonate/bicarbonate transport system permease component
MARRCVSPINGALIYSYPLLLILVAWEAISQVGFVRPIFLPPVTQVFEQLWALLLEHEIMMPLLTSLFRASAGLALAVMFGLIIGLLMARSRLVHWAVDPLVSFGFPAPKIAFVPIFILWFGIDSLSKILLVAFTCVFPIIIATHHGAMAVSRTIIWSAQAMGTSERKLLLRVILPSSLPYVFTGIRVTLPVALITAFTAEMIAGGGGVGAQLMLAQRFFQTPTVFAYILVMLVTGFLFDRLMLHLHGWLMPWEDDPVA